MTTTYVLIPGAGGAGSYWSQLDPELRRRGHDVVTVDLPAADDNAGLAEYADTVVDAVHDCGTPGDDGLVVVAQSMGGFTAPLVCGRLPVTLLVLVNAMIPTPGESAGAWWANTGQDAARRANDLREGRTADAEFDPFVYFLHDVPPEVIASSASDPTPQSDTPFGQTWPLSAWPDVPTRVLAGRDDRFFPVDFQVRVARDRLGITPDQMPGGHLVALSQPVGLADRLEAYQAGA